MFNLSQGTASFGQAAALKQRQQENIFDQIARSIQQRQYAEMMDLKKQEILADQAERDADPKRLASAGFMAMASGKEPTPEQMAAMRFIDAQNMADVKVDQYGNVHQDQSLFDLIAPSATGGRSPVAPTGGNYGQGNPAVGTPYDQIEPLPMNQQGFDVTQFIGQPVPQRPIRNKADEIAYSAEVDLFKDKQKRAMDEMEEKKVEKKGRDKFEVSLKSVLDDLMELDKRGGIAITAADDASAKDKAMVALSNPIRRLANTQSLDPWGITPGGQDIAQMVGTKNQDLRDQIKSKIPLMFGAIREAGGMTGKELDTAKEREFYLNSLINSGARIDTVLETMEGISREFGSGEVADNIAKYRKQVEAQKYGGSNKLRGMSKEERRQLYLKMKGRQ